MSSISKTKSCFNWQNHLWECKCLDFLVQLSIETVNGNGLGMWAEGMQVQRKGRSTGIRERSGKKGGLRELLLSSAELSFFLSFLARWTHDSGRGRKGVSFEDLAPEFMRYLQETWPWMSLLTARTSRLFCKIGVISELLIWKVSHGAQTRREIWKCFAGRTPYAKGSSHLQ